MMRANHSSYWSLSGGWRVSISLKSAGMNLVIRRRARLPLISASKQSRNAYFGVDCAAQSSVSITPSGAEALMIDIDHDFANPENSRPGFVHALTDHMFEGFLDHASAARTSSSSLVD